VFHLPASLILLADPSPTEREMYCEYLRWRGYRIELCGDGGDVFERALALQPDVVCLSFVMGATNGAQVCAALHGDRRTAGIPVIILTTLTSELDMAVARASGCDALLVKPCLPERLRDEAARLIVRSQRARRRAMSGAVARARYG
jgi:two-component system, cell cycle response regulator DivK